MAAQSEPWSAYSIVGYLLGALVAVVGFVGSWAYCVQEYGFLLGVGLGWLPASIVASISFWVIRFAWPLVLLGGWYLLR